MSSMLGSLDDMHFGLDDDDGDRTRYGDRKGDGEEEDGEDV